MKLLTQQCAGGGCHRHGCGAAASPRRGEPATAQAAVRAKLPQAGGAPGLRSLPRPFSPATPDSSESKPTQTALGSFCELGGGGGPGNLPTSSSPPFGDLPPLADLLLLPLPSRPVTLRTAGKAQRPRPQGGRQRTGEPGAERTLCFPLGPGLAGLSRP